MGTFCSTVAYLLSPANSHPCPWRVVRNEKRAPKCLHRNVMKFTIPKYVGTVSLIDHFSHFELHLCTHPKKAAQLWKLAHDAVFAGLKKAGKTIGYTNNTPVPAIVCPAHPRPAKPHPATVDKDRVWTCSIDPEKFGDVDEDSIPWLTLCTSTSAESATPSPFPSSSAVPSSSQPPLSISTAPASSTTATTTTNTPVSTAPHPVSSIPVISRMSLTVIARDHLKNWKTFGPFLGLTEQQETAIANNNPHDYDLQKRECLEVWKKRRGREATYRALISAQKRRGTKSWRTTSKLRWILPRQGP
ncbi:hypothetical protein GBAR_LOCUS27538 [Geodia barretti]|uniref:Death domain-containing protein n=1 Tax=Geodia barretti TaxID=519541 RepID=A0AA35TLE2_GEOBA|nr:hypothetical protein GBAR_LOCUS27538 [Geodia barretti]